MKNVRSLRDLDQFGIIPLTGEACQLGARILCDLTVPGREIICETFGIRNLKDAFEDNWNSRGESSFMLPYDAWVTIAVIALFKNKDVLCCAHFERHGVIGIEQSDLNEEHPTHYAWVEHLKHAYGEPVRTYSPLGGPAVGLRSTHAMTGRTT